MIGLARTLTVALARALFRSRLELMVENLALRQQLALFKQRHSRPRLRPADRVFWVFLRQALRHWANALIVVESGAPSTSTSIYGVLIGGCALLYSATPETPRGTVAQNQRVKPEPWSLNPEPTTDSILSRHRYKQIANYGGPPTRLDLQTESDEETCQASAGRVHRHQTPGLPERAGFGGGRNTQAPHRGDQGRTVLTRGRTLGACCLALLTREKTCTGAVPSFECALRRFSLSK
jgi:hypothetical protein